MRYFFLIVAFVLVSCSVKKMAIDELSPALSEASDSLQWEKNWDFFASATPGSLQLMQTFLYTSPKNEDLLATLTKGFAAYGFIVSDTVHLKDRLQQTDASQAKSATVHNFSQALSYGFRYLELKGLTAKRIVEMARENNRDKNSFDAYLSAGSNLDLETMFYSGLSWLMLANNNKDKIALVGQLSAAYSMIEWTCKHEPDFQKGLCPTLTGVYYLGRPKMLGGKPEEAKKILSEAMEKYPENFVIPAMYMEWYLIPFGEKDQYDKVKNKCLGPLRDLVLSVKVPTEEEKERAPISLNLLNAMALKRMETMASLDKTLF